MTRPLLLALTLLTLASCTSPTQPDGDLRCDATVYLDRGQAQVPDSLKFYNCEASP